MAANSKIILHDVDFRETKNAHCFEVHSFLFLEFLRIREFKGKIARERIIKRRQIQKLFWTISVSVKRNIHSFLFFKFLRIRKFKGKIARERIIKMAANSKIILNDIGFCEMKYIFFEIYSFLFFKFIRIQEFKRKIARS